VSVLCRCLAVQCRLARRLRAPDAVQEYDIGRRCRQRCAAPGLELEKVRVIHRYLSWTGRQKQRRRHLPRPIRRPVPRPNGLSGYLAASVISLAVFAVVFSGVRDKTRGLVGGRKHASIRPVLFRALAGPPLAGGKYGAKPWHRCRPCCPRPNVGRNCSAFV